MSWRLLGWTDSFVHDQCEHDAPALVCLQAEGVVSGAETKRWRASWSAAAEAQWAAAGAGKFKESAAQFLISSWQGDALSVSHPEQHVTRAACCRTLLVGQHFCMHRLCADVCCMPVHIITAGHACLKLGSCISGLVGCAAVPTVLRSPLRAPLKVIPARNLRVCRSPPCSVWARPSAKYHQASTHILRSVFRRCRHADL